MAHSKKLHRNNQIPKLRSFAAAKVQNDVAYQMASLFKAIQPDQAGKLARSLVKKSLSRPMPQLFYGKFNLN